MSRESTDEKLISRFVEATSEFSVREAAGFVGVSHGTIQRWKKGGIGELQPGTRRAVEEWLRSGSAAAVREPRAPRYGSDDASDFARELAKLDELQINEREKTLRIDAIAAGFRAEALRRDAAAAEMRAAALRADADGARGRQGVIDRVREIPTIPPTPVPRQPQRRRGAS